MSELRAAGLVLWREEAGVRRYLLLHSVRHQEWGFPKGHAEAGESLYATALRECAEECGIALVAPLAEPVPLHYRLPDGRAKAVAYFPARTAQTAVVLSSEHDRGEWLPVTTARRRLPHEQLRALLDAVDAGPQTEER